MSQTCLVPQTPKQIEINNLTTAFMQEFEARYQQSPKLAEEFKQQHVAKHTRKIAQLGKTQSSEEYANRYQQVLHEMKIMSQKSYAAFQFTQSKKPLMLRKRTYNTAHMA